MITPAQAMAFFSVADQDEAMQAYQVAKEILIERGFIRSDDAPKRGRSRGKARQAVLVDPGSMAFPLEYK